VAWRAPLGGTDAALRALGGIVVALGRECTQAHTTGSATRQNGLHVASACQILAKTKTSMLPML